MGWSFYPGQLVKVAPADTDDSVAVSMEGQTLRVRRMKQAASLNWLVYLETVEEHPLYMCLRACDLEPLG